MGKADTVPKLKGKLDRAMSQWVRHNYSPDGINVACFTCDKPMLIKDAHSGHYIPRTESPTRYDERNQRPQCPGCNTFRSGMPHEFRRRLVEEIGPDAVEDLETKSKQPWKWDRSWLREQTEYYRAEVRKMEQAA